MIQQVHFYRQLNSILSNLFEKTYSKPYYLGPSKMKGLKAKVECPVHQPLGTPISIQYSDPKFPSTLKI